MTLEAQVKEFEHLKSLKMKMQFRGLIMQELDQIENPENLTAKVQLYQKKNNEDYVAVETITNADGRTYNGEITLPIEGSWEYSWEKLPRIDTDGNGYAYKLEEVEVPVDYVSSYTLNETENEKNYHLKNYHHHPLYLHIFQTEKWYLIQLHLV